MPLDPLVPPPMMVTLSAPGAMRMPTLPFTRSSAPPTILFLLRSRVFPLAAIVRPTFWVAQPRPEVSCMVVSDPWKAFEATVSPQRIDPVRKLGRNMTGARSARKVTSFVRSPSLGSSPPTAWSTWACTTSGRVIVLTWGAWAVTVTLAVACAAILANVAVTTVGDELPHTTPTPFGVVVHFT